MLAHVRGRAPVDRGAVGEQRNAVGLAAGQDQVRAVGAAHDRHQLLRVRTDDRDLSHARQVEVKRLQRVAERERVAADHRRQQAQDGQRLGLVAGLARQQRQTQQPVRGGGVPGRDRRVLEVLAPGERLRHAGRRGEEAAVLGVGEALDHLVGERDRLVVPAGLERRLV